MKLYDRLKKVREDNKGFTLVELIVVLVILAILAAILVPALLGYIDRAKESQYELEANAVMTAIQGESSKLYATAKPGTMVTEASFNGSNNALGTSVMNTADVKNLVITDVVSKWENEGGEASDVDTTDKLHQAYTVVGMTITFDSANGGKTVTCVLADGVWTCTPAANSGNGSGN